MFQKLKENDNIINILTILVFEQTKIW